MANPLLLYCIVFEKKGQIVNQPRINQKPGNWPVWLLVLMTLIILAIVISIILSWLYFKDSAVPGCGTGSSCDQVLSSRWSSLAGIVPVSGLALGTYLAMFVTSLNIRSSIEFSIRYLSWNLLLILAGAIIGSAVWFTILQKWIIESFCIYCMTAHITGLLISTLIIYRIVKERDIAKKERLLIKPIRIVGLILAGLSISGIVALIQINDTPIAIKQKIDQHDLHTQIDDKNAPKIGSPDATHKVLLLFDYQCAHCQKIHFMLNAAVQQYNGELAFVLMPTPLDNRCNPFVPSETKTFNNSSELARIGLAVWQANPTLFFEFENWMFTFDSGNSWHPRSPEAAMVKAAELVGAEMLETALADPWIDQYLQTGIQLFGQTLQNSRGGIPKMMYGSKWIIPEPYDANDLVGILQKSLGIPKP